MADNVVYLHGKPREISLATRVGFREHGVCEQLLSANKLTSRTFVLDAATEGTRRQKNLVRSLKDRKAEIVLDTSCAELSVPGRLCGSAKSTPWAAEGRVLEAADFTPGTNRSVIELRNPESHNAVQTGKLVKSLSEIPESLRAKQFLEKYLLERVKTAGRANKIRNMDDDLRKKICTSAKRVELAYEALSGLHDRMGSIEFPVEAKFRSGSRQTEMFQERLS